MTAYFLAQPFYVMKTGGIFLRGDDTTGLGKFFKRLVDELDVLRLEMVMVGKGERREVLAVWLQVVNHLLWRCNARQQENLLVSLQTFQRT